jgi:hypothetical protein
MTLTKPFINKDGKWATIARTAAVSYTHVVTRSRWDHYGIDGQVNEQVVADLAYGLTAQTALTLAAANALLAEAMA